MIIKGSNLLAAV